MKEIKKMVQDYWFAVVICLISLKIISAIFGSVCYSTILFGIPCPACGITRATILMVTGHFFESFHMHPLLILVIIGFVLYPIMKKMLKNYRFFINFYVIICMMIFVVFYIYRMHMYYPNMEPMVYTGDNFLAKFLGLIEYMRQQ